MLSFAAAGIGAVLALWLLLLASFAKPLRALLREPIFKRPVLIFESDDWGPGPPDHADALHSIAATLRGFTDSDGHHPIMTLGVILATPDGAATTSDARAELTLQDPRLAGIVEAMQAGVRSGVFQLQLHGRSHYWPEALAKASESTPEVASWRSGQRAWRTEDLPAGLQSRWAPEIGAESFEIPAEAARAAAEAEARLFGECLGATASVAVPTTFVWNPDVEAGWAAAGIRAIVTPGRYYRRRGQFADPGKAPMITNGMRSERVLYLVRDRYFEPFKGHSAADGLIALAANTALGRPTLLETHRINFLEPALRDKSLAAIRDLLRAALERHRNLRFLSTVELVDAIERSSPELFDGSLRRRIGIWCRRIRTLRSFWRLARATGLALAVASVQRLAAPS